MRDTGGRIVLSALVGAGIGLAVMGFQLSFAAGLMFVVLQISIFAETYATTDALGALATPVFLVLFYAVPAAAIGLVVGGLGGGVAGLVRSRA